MSENLNEPRAWTEFRDAGLLWWVNRMLHLFGWVIVLEMDDLGLVTGVYPARTKYRGFTEEAEADGFQKLSGHLVERMPEAAEDCEHEAAFSTD